MACDFASQMVTRRALHNDAPSELPTEHVPTLREEARDRLADLLERATADL
ncbi:MAG TPA: hypothetical protein VN793_05405 [Acidimicrobiales bacterium]|nr:hypothetical protein [Acidimicrobiales bacterium]